MQENNYLENTWILLSVIIDDNKKENYSQT